jgi:hypothetical protein
MGLKFYESQVLVWSSQVLMSLKQFNTAREAAMKSMTIAQELNQQASLAFAKRIMAKVEMVEAEHNNQLDSNQRIKKVIEQYLEESLNIFTNLKMEHEIGRTCMELARFKSITKNIDEMNRYLNQARKIFQELGAMGDLNKLNQIRVKA